MWTFQRTHLFIVTVPDLYLHSECGHVFAPPREVLVTIAGVLKVSGDVPGGYRLIVLRRDHQHALRLLPLKASCHLLLARLLVIATLLQLLHAFHQHFHLATHLLRKQRARWKIYSKETLSEEIQVFWGISGHLHAHTHTFNHALHTHTPSVTTHLVAKQIIVVISMAVAVGNVTDTVLAEGGGSESVSAVAVDLGHDAAAEGERGEGVVVCEEDDGVDELCKGPAVFLCLQKLLEGKKIK